MRDLSPEQNSRFNITLITHPTPYTPTKETCNPTQAQTSKAKTPKQTGGEKTVKGKPWTTQEETELKALIEAKAPIHVMAERLGRKPAAILVKTKRLGLTHPKNTVESSIPLPKELPSVEEVLKILAAALEQANTRKLTKEEIQRLQLVSNLSKTYKEILADYIDYREIEAKLNTMEEKHAQTLQGKTKSTTP